MPSKKCLQIKYEWQFPKILKSKNNKIYLKRRKIYISKAKFVSEKHSFICAF